MLHGATHPEASLVLLTRLPREVPLAATRRRQLQLGGRGELQGLRSDSVKICNRLMFPLQPFSLLRRRATGTGKSRPAARYQRGEQPTHSERSDPHVSARQEVNKD